MRKLLIVLLLFLIQIPCHSQQYEMSTAFKNSGYRRVVELGERILEDQSGDYGVFLLLGKAYNALNKFDEALPFLVKANEYAEIEWQYASAYVELMEAYYGLGVRDKAKRYYNKGTHVRGSKKVQRKFQKLALLFGYNEVYNDWITVETRNFIFHFEDVTSIEYIDKYIEDRIAAYDEINAFYKAYLPKEIDFFVWKSEGIAQKKFKKFLGFTNPKYCVSHNKLTQTVGHEIAHSISYWYNKDNTRNRFINEGIGVYFDLTRSDRMEAARKIIKYQRRISDFKSYDIRVFWINPYEYPERIMYPIAGAFVETLIEHNKDKFLRLTQNQTYENAQDIYGRGQIDRLISNFNKLLNQQ